MRHRLFAALAVVALSATYALATSFVVPEDRVFVRRAPAIAIGSALASRTQLNDKHGIETVTTFSVEEAVKGSFDTDTIDIYEPGGVYENRAMSFPGVPRFKDGERYLLFLIKGQDGQWHVVDLTLGKFHSATDTLGHDVVLRDLNDVVALESNGKPHRESNRAAEPFLNFIRRTVKGGPANDDYLIPAEPLVGSPFPIPHPGANGRLKPGILAAFMAESYTSDLSLGFGARWTAFPVNFGSIGSETGAPGSPAGATAINTAFNAWNTAPGASVNYVYTGNDVSNTTNSPCAGADTKNTIAFEYDFQTLAPCYGITPFVCGVGGTLGLGGTSNAATPYNFLPDGSQFFQTLEGDVWMNKGIANCTSLFTSGDFNSAVTHEVGHTLGFRHADQTRADTVSPACSTDVTLECASTAIMHAVVNNGLNATLQAWDQHAVAGVYPASAPAAVAGVVAIATTPTNVQVSWTGSCVTTCHVYRSRYNDRLTFDLAGSGTSPFSDTGAIGGRAYLYKVKNFDGSTESGDSNLDLATTVIYSNTIGTGGTIKAIDTNEMRNAIDAVRTLYGVGAGSYTFGSGTPVRVTTGETIYATDMNEMRTNLDTAYFGIFVAHPTYTNTITGGGSVVIKALDFNEVRNWMK